MVRRIILVLGLLGGSVVSANDAPSGAFEASSNGGYDVVGGGGRFISPADLKSKSGQRSDFPVISAPDSLIRLSPGDQLRLRWWGVGSGDLDLVIDTRGDLIVPDMGRIPTRNKSFKLVRDTIEAILKRRVKPNLIDLQIVQMRKASIRVSGLVGRPGLFDCVPGIHVSQALRLAGFDINTAMDSLNSDLPGLFYPDQLNPSLRKVLVVRGEDSSTVDLLRALRTGDPSQDPLLFDGDAIRILPRDYVVSVTGGAHPGYVEMIQGEPLTGILAALGETDTVRPVEIMDARGNTRQVKPNEARVDTSLSLLRIPPRRIVSLPPVVWVVGQVVKPGAYPFSPGSKAGEMVKAAGGILGGEDSGVVVGTKRAWNWLAAARERSLTESFQLPELKVAMIDYFNHMKGNYSDPDAPIQVGDTVFVYKAEHVVWVAGQVNRPGFVPWKKNANYQYYVDAAGGFTPRAWEVRSQVFDWQTMQAMGLDQTIRPGAAVVVPEERFIPADQWFSIAVTTASLMIAVAGLMIQVSK